jgi:DNA-binding response OmpR family regulator
MPLPLGAIQPHMIQRPTSGILTIADLRIDLDVMKATYRGRPLQLERDVVRVLSTLALNAGRAISRWNLQSTASKQATRGRGSVDVAITKIRKELGEPWLIQTITGVGYMFVAPKDAIEDRMIKTALGDLTFNRAGPSVLLGGTEIRLTSMEYRILLRLAHRAGSVLSRLALSDQVTAGDPQNKQVDIHIAAIRKKLGDHDGALIQTVRNKGYLLRGERLNVLRGAKPVKDVFDRPTGSRGPQPEK